MRKIFSFLSWVEWIIVATTLSFGGSLVYLSQKMTHYVAENEMQKVNIFVEAIWLLSTPDMMDMVDFQFLNKVVESNKDVPIIVLNESSEILSLKNIDSALVSTPEKLEEQLEKMSQYQKPIEKYISGEGAIYVYYYASPFLQFVKFAPIWQLLIMISIVALGYYFINQKRKSDSNKLWVGLAKETAHQLGTPTTALLGWIDVLEDKEVEPEVIEEMRKDIKVMQRVIDRFSKIGSQTVLKPTDIYLLAVSSFDYVKNRVSKKINFQFRTNVQTYILPVNPVLLTWVIENLLVNAVDAVGQEGEITLKLEQHNTNLFIFVTDNGKGIPNKNFQKIFQPGFTTKKRGWGLGLSLCRRIIQNYHKGKIEVLQSTVDKGTTMKVTLYGKHQ